MMNIGIVRKVDELGRIVLPMEFRKLYHIKKTDEVELIGTDKGILIRIPGLRIIRCEDDENGNQERGC